MAQKVEEAMRTMPSMPKLDSESWANSKYHKVGYMREPKAIPKHDDLMIWYI